MTEVRRQTLFTEYKIGFVDHLANQELLNLSFRATVKQHDRSTVAAGQVTQDHCRNRNHLLATRRLDKTGNLRANQTSNHSLYYVHDSPKC